MVENLLVLTFAFACACFLVAVLAERRKAGRLHVQQELHSLVGMFYVSDVRIQKDGSLSLALKNNTAKYWVPVLCDHPCYKELAKAKGRFIKASLTGDARCINDLWVEFVYDFNDPLQTLINTAEQTLTEAVSEWPLVGTAHEQHVAALAGVEAPLDYERVMRALVTWHRTFKHCPPVAAFLASTALAMQRQKVFRRLSSQAKELQST